MISRSLSLLVVLISIFRLAEAAECSAIFTDGLQNNNNSGSITFNNKDYPVVELTDTVFEENEVHIAFFSAGGSISEKFAKYAVEGGAVVIDNTSHFRMDPNVPLVVPEVNPEDISLSLIHI